MQPNLILVFANQYVIGKAHRRKYVHNCIKSMACKICLDVSHTKHLEAGLITFLFRLVIHTTGSAHFYFP